MRGGGERDRTLKRRRAERAAETGRRMQMMSLRIEDVYGGVIAVRQREDDPALIGLAASIRRHGLLQPILVRSNPQAGRYVLVCGARRLAACRMAGLSTIDALVLEADEAEAAACFMEEHLTRRAPELIDEAQAVERAGAEAVLARFALPGHLLTERLRLLMLPEAVRMQLAGMTLSQALPLLRVHGEARQLEAAQIIASRSLTGVQAQRLVMGPQQRVESVRRGRRRAVQEAMETITRLVRRLSMQGVPTSVSLHSQEGGVCIRILLRNGEKQGGTAGNERQTENK